MEEQVKTNPLGTDKVTGLMVRFAIPSIIAMVIGAVYNIIDQLFIGNMVGELGNAATNVVFPMTTLCTALALLFGIGGASCFNLTLGKGDPEKAVHYVGNSLIMLFLSGLVMCAVAEIFMAPLLHAFGTPDDVFPYATTYLRITAIGFPFLIVTTGGGHLMRADGSPRMTMISSLTGALINTGLDALFVVGFKWGMAGAAFATIIGQIVSTIIIICYMTHFKTVHLGREHLRLRPEHIGFIASVGMAPFFNQICGVVVQLVLNNSLTRYGAMSQFGESTPLAVAGIIMKVNMIAMSIIIGLAQGAQPIMSFNYGAKRFQRVRDAYRIALIIGGVISICAFLLYWFFPRQILSAFGADSEAFYEFGVLFFHTFMFFTWLNFVQMISTNFFTSIGKARKGVFLSLTRQLIFLVPLLLILPIRFGIMGLLYAAPVADLASAIVTICMVVGEMRIMRKTEAALTS